MLHTYLFFSSGSGIVVPIIQTTTGSVVAPLLGTGMAEESQTQGRDEPRVQVNQPSRRRQRQSNSQSSQVSLRYYLLELILYHFRIDF